ncbi:hypothetical protein HYU17_04095 [Candidatus Woesearchaeota archaeon]|nr:hypothetical protein [Candidatus Woesearchaeota archaeon]
MGEELVKITPDRERAMSIMKMAETTLELVKSLDAAKFSSNIVKDYYDTIRELLSIVALLDGFKTQGQGAHKKLIEYIGRAYKLLSEHELSLIDDLRIARTRLHTMASLCLPITCQETKKP